MPKVNLLPRDRAAKNKARQGWIGAAFAVIAFIAVLGLSFAWFKGQEVSERQWRDALGVVRACVGLDLGVLQAEARERGLGLLLDRLLATDAS